MAANPQSAGVLSFEQAYETVQQYCRTLKPPAEESVSIAEVPGRVLSSPVLADRDFPPFPRATRDGFAVRAADLKSIPAFLRIVGEVKAGGEYAGTLESGQAVEIMTGAAVPEGADAVVMVEYTSRQEEMVEIKRGCAAGENVVPRGSEARVGQEMLARGTRMSFAQVAIAAAAGTARLGVYARPKVAVLATGDELVEINQTPGAHQIRNSNSYSLAAQVALGGGEAVRLPIGPDEPEALRKLIQQGLSADLLLLSGGVSMGKFDLVEQVLGEAGARFFFTGAQIQPGRPVVFGEAPGASTGKPIPFFGLPGNPVSTMVTFDLFVSPVLHALGGAIPVRLPAAKARLKKEVKSKTGLTRFLPAMLSGGLFDAQVESIAWQGSGDLMSAARANCYLVVPPDRDRMAEGEMVSILLRPCQ